MKKTNVFLLLVIFLLALHACKTDGFNRQEQQRILDQTNNGSIMPLFTVNVNSDSLLLRQQARRINSRNLQKPLMTLLKNRMLATVNDSLNLGVGIAAPQVGISVQMVLVQRFDKEAEPFEVYYNPVIVAYGDSIKAGREGCLSVPHYRSEVERAQSIVLSYLDSTGKERTEEIKGFTAVIFQHEVDHIKGKLYYDHVEGGFNALTEIEEL